MMRLMPPARSTLLALLLPAAAWAAETNRLDLAFQEAPLSEVAEFLNQKSGLNLILPSARADLSLSLRAKEVTPADTVALMNAVMAGDEIGFRWKPTQLSGDKLAYILEESDEPLASQSLEEFLPKAAPAPRFSIHLAESSLKDAVAYLDKLTGGSLLLVHGQAIADFQISLKLQDVTPSDLLMAINSLLRADGVQMAWRALDLPSGRQALALLPLPAAAAKESNTREEPVRFPRVYYIGDLDPDLRRTAVLLEDLAQKAGIFPLLRLHEETRMLVVIATEPEHPFMLNAVEEFRKAAENARKAAPKAP